jgi:formate dehydrogenase major subunit
VLWDGGSTINESSCVSCGHCVTVCPCNALMEKSMIRHAGFFTGLSKPALNGMIDIVKGIEPETGYGTAILKVSEVEAACASRAFAAPRPCAPIAASAAASMSGRKTGTSSRSSRNTARPTAFQPASRGNSAGTSSTAPIASPRRSSARATRFREASWDEALSLVARRLAEIKQRSRPDSLAFISSSKCTNEESYLMQKLARAVIGTNNIDNCSRYCQAPATKGLFRTVGYGGDSGSIGDIEKADLVIIVGSNTAESHPVLATRVKSDLTSCRGRSSSSPTSASMRWRGGPTCSSIRAGHRSGLAFRDQPLHSRQRPAQSNGVPRSSG